MKFLWLALTLSFISCNDTTQVRPELHSSCVKEQQKVITDSVREIYTDSTTIGKKGKNKIVLKSIANTESIYADIRFYIKAGNKWIEKQHFKWRKDGVTSCEPQFTDFNNDGYTDFTYISAIAARGANEIRTLFIYDPKSEILRRMKNSEEYPNLQYNAKLDCIDAFAVYGGTTSYFLKIEKDSLYPFARVDLFDGYREIYKMDKYAKEKLIKREPFETSYLRYKNFSPLEAYETF